MCFKISKKQFFFLILFALIGGIIGVTSEWVSSIFCKSGGLCPTPKLVLTSIYGFLIFGAITYLIEIIYNYFKKQCL